MNAFNNNRPNEEEPYMSQRQKYFFKERLLQWRDSLVNVQSRCSTQLNQENTRVPDISDQVVESANRNMAYINGQRSQLIIRQINAALQLRLLL